MNIRTTILLALLALSMTGCTRNVDEQPKDITVHTATQGAQWAWQIAHDSVNIRRLRPSGLLGVFVAQYLIQGSTFGSALSGIATYVQIRGDENIDRGEDFALLEALGAAMQADVPDLLNRSPVRATAFDAYTNALTDLLRRASARLERLQQEMTQLNDERRTQRKEVSTIQRELNTALREKQYGIASDIQQRLQKAETTLATTEAKLDTQQSIINLYEKLQTLGERRIIAMQENREVLIAGLKVIDLPGIDALGILETGDLRALRSEGSPYQFLFQGL